MPCNAAKRSPPGRGYRIQRLFSPKCQSLLPVWKLTVEVGGQRTKSNIILMVTFENIENPQNSHDRLFFVLSIEPFKAFQCPTE